MTMQETDPQERLGGDAPRPLLRPAGDERHAAAATARLGGHPIDRVHRVRGRRRRDPPGLGDRQRIRRSRAWTLVAVLAAAFILRHR